MLDKVYLITMPNIVIAFFDVFFNNFLKWFKNYIKYNIISNGYKHQWNQSNKHNTNFYIEQLLCFVMIPST